MGPEESAGLHYASVRRLLPGPGIPPEVKLQRSLNNVDICLHAGRYYVAFRTAPSHFASRKTHTYVISSADMQTWRLDWQVNLKSDMREPRLLSWQGKLRLYFFQGGTNAFRFQPRHVYMAEQQDTGWKLSLVPGLDGFVPWRARVYDGQILLSAYWGVDIYNNKHQPNLRLFTSKDGLNFAPLTECPQNSRPGAEEAEFNFDNRGNLWATIRFEGGGGGLAFGPRGNIGTWQTTYLKDKFDSALMFNHEGRLYLVARRNLDGAADKWDSAASNAKPEKGHINNMFRYWVTRKVTAIWEVDTARKAFRHLLDLPSTGDCSFAGIAPNPQNPNHYWLVNYSSDIDKRPKNWIRGQLGRTYIYLFDLRMAP
jgi:hypothetical protein